MSAGHHFPDKIRSLPIFKGAFDAHQLHGDNCEVLFASYPAGMEIDTHHHDSENHGVVTAGELTMVVNGEERRYTPGDWYFLSALEEHSASFRVNTSLIEFWFQPNT